MEGFSLFKEPWLPAAPESHSYPRREESAENETQLAGVAHAPAPDPSAGRLLESVSLLHSAAAVCITRPLRVLKP